VRLLARLGLFALPLLLVSACTLGPRYKRPPVATPDHWREIETAESASIANTPWWELFQDEQLKKLIHTALAENKDLKIAVERITEARASMASPRRPVPETRPRGHGRHRHQHRQPDAPAGRHQH
jgi:multidrug efflux system outer membrane protein